ncbi:hypothetical protein CAC42_7972 [Sphaceloma murrayae]|uniref:Uncharacterized protein n=1 Tax=Sphaceloma murrayae TaxID=2082308 RepID=A0A2K1QL12_9PEZI|nr:hypothetical protein CAC42_7972 [Sphaceloma murrayae]
MRFLPDPHEGLHPALPKPPPPLLDNSISGAPVFGGVLGSLALVGSLATRRRPVLGLQVAAFSTSAFAFLALGNRLISSQAHTAFLKSKGIETPSPKLVERWRELDQENVIFAGGLLGIILRIGRVNPGGLLARWTRAEIPRVSMTTELIGSFAFGSLAGVAGLQILPLPGTREALLELWKNRQIAQQYREELQEYERMHSWTNESLLGRLFGREEQTAPSQAMGTGPSNMGALLSSLGSQFSGGRDADPPDMHLGAELFASEIDSEDPKPHHSEMVNGRRLFVASRNHEYEPRSERELNDHLEELRTQRDELLPEAELIWHKMAAAEAKYLPLEKDIDNADEVLADMRSRALLRLLNNTHAYLWSQISDIDWMIADTNKQIEQLKAKKVGRTWEAGLSNRARDVLPRNAIEFLAIGLAQQQMQLGMVEQQIKQGVGEYDRLKKELPKEVSEAQYGTDPRRAKMDELERVALTQGSMQKFVEVSMDLIKELGKGEVDVSVVVKEVEGRDGVN